MTFDEEFPSLKNKLRNFELPNQDGYEDFLQINDVQEYCLDKQKLDKMTKEYWDLLVNAGEIKMAGAVAVIRGKLRL